MANLETIDVVAAVVTDALGRVLVCRRPPHKRHGNLWEFPGGKIEAGETAFDAARRELAEELGFAVTSVGTPVFSIQDPGSPFRIMFYPVVVEGDPTPVEHTAIRWSEWTELGDLELAPSDAAFARQRSG